MEAAHPRPRFASQHPVQYGCRSYTGVRPGRYPHWPQVMATQDTAQGPALTSVDFEVERFEWTSGDRLEVAGRWFGVRGRRFVRPVLNLQLPGGRRRLIALLEHKPWAPHEGEAWIAAFAWEGEQEAVEAVELEVGPSLVVALPAPGGGAPVAPRAPSAPRLPARPSGQREEAAALRLEVERLRGELARTRDEAHEAGKTIARLEGDLARRSSPPTQPDPELVAERDAALAARDEARAERDATPSDRAELDAARQERDAALAARQAALTAPPADEVVAAIAERDAARAELDAAHEARDAAQQERDAALGRALAAEGSREALEFERDQAIATRDAAVAERDAAAAERDAAVRARDNARNRARRAGAAVDGPASAQAGAPSPDAPAAPPSAAPPPQAETPPGARDPNLRPCRAAHPSPLPSRGVGDPPARADPARGCRDRSARRRARRALKDPLRVICSQPAHRVATGRRD